MAAKRPKKAGKSTKRLKKANQLESTKTLSKTGFSHFA